MECKDKEKNPHVPFLAVLGQDAKVLKIKCRFEWQEKIVPNLYRTIMIPSQTEFRSP